MIHVFLVILIIIDIILISTASEKSIASEFKLFLLIKIVPHFTVRTVQCSISLLYQRTKC